MSGPVDGGVQDFRATIEAMHRELIAAANAGVFRFDDIPPLPDRIHNPAAGEAGLMRRLVDVDDRDARDAFREGVAVGWAEAIEAAAELRSIPVWARDEVVRGLRRASGLPGGVS